MNPLKILSVLFTGIFIAYRISVIADGVSIIESVLDFTIIVMAACLVIFVVWQDLKTFRQVKRVSAFTGTGFCFFMIMVCGAVQFYYYKRAHVPILVYGSYGNPFSSTSIALRTDGTYLVKARGIEPYSFYGEYRLHDSIVVLKPDYIVGITGSKLIIRTSESIIIRVDSSGKEVPDFDRFRLSKDNRKLH